MDPKDDTGHRPAKTPAEPYHSIQVAHRVFFPGTIRKITVFIQDVTVNERQGFMKQSPVFLDQPSLRSPDRSG